MLMHAALQSRSASPSLPKARGPLSAAVLDLLTHRSGSRPTAQDVAKADPYGEDLQLALYTCYELHYRGFAGVDADREWDTDVLGFRADLERAFLTALREDVQGGDNTDQVLDTLLVENVDARGLSHFLRDEAVRWQMCEYIMHRSIYHLKEAEPHAWVIPRLEGEAKAALVAVEFDEFGGGRAERMHSGLFADLMTDLGLDPGYGRYLDVVPAPMLAIVTMMSLFGLHRSLRGALVGHFAAAEISTAPSARRMADALERLDAGQAAIHFYTEHIAADAVHEQVMRRQVIGDLLRREPELAADVVLGIQATEHLEERFGRYVLDAWSQGRSSLLPGGRHPEAGTGS